MGSPVPGEVTGLLLAWSEGDQIALQKLVPIVYKELHRLAHLYIHRERVGHTLQATALVHEAYQKLVDTPRVHWQDRAHFFAICAQLMRRVLVDYARSRNYQKRGGDICIVPLEEAFGASQDRRKDLLAIDEALSALAAIDPRKGQVVELRFFGGLTAEETAEVLKISPDTVLRDWKIARSWLLRELKGGARHDA